MTLVTATDGAGLMWRDCDSPAICDRTRHSNHPTIASPSGVAAGHASQPITPYRRRRHLKFWEGQGSGRVRQRSANVLVTRAVTSVPTSSATVSRRAETRQIVDAAVC